MYKDKALELLDGHKLGKLSQKGQAVSSAVVDILRRFCLQEDEFAQAFIQSEKPIEDCIEHTVKGAGNSISDLDIYKRAAEFYLPGAKVKMELSIDLVGDAAAPSAPENENSTPPGQKNKIVFSFDDLF